MIHGDDRTPVSVSETGSPAPKRKKTDNPCKSWDFTIHFTNLNIEVGWLKSLEVSTLIAALEVGDKTKKEHIQGRVVFKRAYRLGQLKKIHSSAHWEATKCHMDANYCRKRDSTPLLDIDNRKKKGQRTDIEEAKQIVQETQSMRQVVETTTSFQAVRMCEVYLKYKERRRPIDIDKLKVHWRYGPSGCNKTRQVWESHAVDDIFTPTTYKWWEGYDGHPVVLIDEFRGGWCKFSELLHILDVYPYRVEVKGGSREIQAYTFYITTCYAPDKVYRNEELSTDDRIWQLIRRLTTVTRSYMSLNGPAEEDMTAKFKEAYDPTML